MLLSLIIRDFIIVETLEVDFSAGFTALTGETGAGKSLLIDALGFVLGSRADAHCIREGCARAEITAEFSLNPMAFEWLKTAEIDTDELAGNPSVLIRRSLDSSGRARSFINGVPTPLNQVRELGSMLLDIHGQHEHQSLLKPAAQSGLLDRHAKLVPQANQVAMAYRVWRQAEQALAQAKVDQETSETQRQHWLDITQDLEALAPLSGEWDQICSEHQRLSHATTLIDGVQEVIAVLNDQEDALVVQLARLESKLQALSQFDENLSTVLEGLRAAQIHLDDGARQLRRYLNQIESDDSRLAQVDARLSRWHAAARRWRRAPEQLPELLGEAQAALAALERNLDLASLEEATHRTKAHYLALAQDLGKQRLSAAAQMAADITLTMQALAMTGGRLDIRLEACEAGPNGLERPEFLVAAHANGLARPLAKVASGGELSRIGLAIAVVAAANNLVPTLIFDEVDAGVGGQVASTVGKLLSTLGNSRQVFCVTHLPQVAAYAKHHLHVSKKPGSNGAPVSNTQILSQEERITELARMLGSNDLTPLAKEHARQLLAAAQQV